MQKVEIRKCCHISNKLQLVKLIKEYSGKGLKDSKDWVDRFDYHGKTYSQFIDVYDPISFEIDIMKVEGVEFISNIRKREEKLIKIGIGSQEDKINYLSYKMARVLIEECELNSKNLTRISNFLRTIIDKLDDNNIEILIQDE